MNNILQQALYAEVKKAAAGRRVMMQTLRIEKLTASGTSSYNFDIQAQSRSVNPYPGENILQVQDAFVVHEMGFFLKEEDPAKKNSAPLQTYANANAFTAVAGEVVVADLQSLWNGSLSIKQDNVVIQDKIDLSQSLHVPETLQSTGQSVRNSEEDGFFPLIPIHTFRGSAQIGLTVNFPSYAAQYIQHTTSTTKRIYAVLCFRGFLIVNGSQVGALNDVYYK